jgi:hypothetical protein
MTLLRERCVTADERELAGPNDRASVTNVLRSAK